MPRSSVRTRLEGWFHGGGALLTIALLWSCSPADSGTPAGGGGSPSVGSSGGAGGSTGGASGGNASQATGGGSGGTVEPTGGSGGGASGGAVGSGGDASGGTAATGGAGGSAGQLGSGGEPGSGGGSSGPHVCNEFTGGALIDELFIAGFEDTVDAAHWQLKWKNYAAIEEWANAQSAFWDAPVESACTSGSGSPERVVLMVFSWSVTTEEDWTSKLTQTVENFIAKYPALVRLDLMNQVTGPGNMLCPTPPAAGETIVVSAELEAAMETVASDYPGFVFLSPRWEAQSCADFVGGGPHLTSTGNMLAVGSMATHFATTQ